MNNIRTILVILIMGLMAAPALADRKADLQERFKARFTELNKLKTAGKVGETFQGYAGAVKEQKLDAAADKLLSDENTDRKELYTIIAEEVKTTPENVAMQNAKRRLEKLATGHWYKFEDRGWAQKK